MSLTSPTFHRLHKEARPPIRAYESSAGWDLFAFNFSESSHRMTITIAPHSIRLIRTGLAIMAPPGMCVLICSRSGLASRGVFVANAPGVVDPDYVGEIQVALFNGSQEPHYVRHEDRIAQALIIPICRQPFIETTSLPSTERGSKGLGSTGA